jgi:hypothetical protein
MYIFMRFIRHQCYVPLRIFMGFIRYQILCTAIHFHAVFTYVILRIDLLYEERFLEQDDAVRTARNHVKWRIYQTDRNLN